MNEDIGVEFVKGQSGEEARTIARITVPSIPDLVCDLLCYEDKFGAGDGHPQADVSMILEHHRIDNPQIELTTHLIPSSDTLESSVMVVGPDEDAVRSIRRINACWQFRKSDSFVNRGHFVRDFVSR